MVRIAAVLVLALAARSVPAADAAAPHDPRQHHPRADAPLVAFHDLMEPFWHAAPGPALNARACGVKDEIAKRARAVATRPAPEFAELVASARALEGACAGKDDAKVGAELDRLHRIFHRLAGR